MQLFALINIIVRSSISAKAQIEAMYASRRLVGKLPRLQSPSRVQTANPRAEIYRLNGEMLAVYKSDGLDSDPGVTAMHMRSSISIKASGSIG
jgi:hypothetical protein